MGKMGKHPVIFLSFRSLKDSDWEACLSKIKYLIKNEYLKHSYLLDSTTLNPQEKDFFKKIIELEGDKTDFENSLEMLLMLLSQYYEERVVVLIDEYDAPIHAGFTNNYYKTIVLFMCNFLGGGLKDTDKYLEKSVITGILRISQESIFSGLNNPGVFTLTTNEFNDKFGFTEKEVETMLTDFDLLHRHDEIKKWYNGYMFGSKVIYNPWSIINFLENIIMKEIANRDDLLWSFLLMGGYLKQTAKRMDTSKGKFYYTLSIPNLEVRITYLDIINRYFSAKIKNTKLESMLKALIEGDVILFEEILQDVVATVFSYHDFDGQPELVYHALVTGLLVWISGTHEIKSNRESGYGRYNIMIIPKNPALVGYVIEFKAVNKHRKETVKIATAAALQQIEDKKYETELAARGITQIKKLAIVFSGKKVFVKESGKQ